MAARGTVLKMKYQGQKIYAVLDEDKGQTCVVVFPFGTQFHKVEGPRSAFKMPKTAQEEMPFTLLRQLVGINYEKTEKTAPTKVAPAAAKKSLPGIIATIASEGESLSVVACPECHTAFLEGNEKHNPGCSVGEMLGTPKPFTVQHPDLNDGKATPIDQIDDPSGLLKGIQDNLKPFGIDSIKWANEDDKAE